jgi:hypothetical protein
MDEEVRPWTRTVQAHYSDQFADLHEGYGFKFETRRSTRHSRRSPRHGNHRRNSGSGWTAAPHRADRHSAAGPGSARRSASIAREIRSWITACLATIAGICGGRITPPPS